MKQTRFIQVDGEQAWTGFCSVGLFIQDQKHSDHFPENVPSRVIQQFVLHGSLMAGTPLNCLQS